MVMLRLLCSTVLTFCLISTAVLADEPMKGRAEMNLRMGHERSIFMTEFWVPFAQSEELDNVLYGSLRMMGDNQDNREGNLGVGYRQVVDTNDFKGVAGVHGWLDRRITERGSTFHQVTTGVEWLGESVDVRLNGYIPLSDKREITIPNATPQGPELAGTGILIDTNGTVLEEPQGGLDLELGLELGQYSDFIRDNTDRFHVYAGGYYFDGPNTEDVAGWRTRFTADITENIQVGARFQRDDERGSQGFLEATFRFPFSHKKSYRDKGIRARLDESPERDIDIVTGDTVIDSGDRVQVLNATTGTTQEVLHVDNTAGGGGDGSAENPFNSLASAEAAASAHTVIYVNRGDGASTNQDQGITLDKQGQQLIGSGSDFLFDNGIFTTANGASPSSTLIAQATTAPVIGNVNANQDGITINADDITVAGLTVDNANTGRDGIKVIADGVAASAQNITIQNITAQNSRHGVYIHGTNSGAVSTKVQNTTTTSNSQHGIAVYDDTTNTFETDLGGGSMGSTGNNILAGNTLEDLAVDYDGRTLAAQNNWWGQATGADQDTPDIGIAPQIYYGAPINDGLVGHWTFDTEWTTNTTAYDRSGQGNDGSLLGGLSDADLTAGSAREALTFNTNRFANLGTPLAGPNSWTYALRFNPTTTSNGFDGLIGQGNNPRITWGSTAGSQNVHSLVNWSLAPNYKTTSSGAMNVGEWHHTALTVDISNLANQEMSLYLAGALSSSNSWSTGTVTPPSITHFLNQRDASRAYQGQMDDVRVYSRALNPTEISELYRMNTSSTVNTSSFLSSAP